MKTTLLLEYKYPYGVVNSLWAAKERYAYLPDHVIVATPGAPTQHSNELAAMIEAWQRGHGIEANVSFLLINDDPRSMKAAFTQTIECEQQAGRSIAVDVTSGRTVPKLALYRAALDAEPDHVFYLDVENYDYRPDGYPLIPRRIQTARDLDLEDLHVT